MPVIGNLSKGKQSERKPEKQHILNTPFKIHILGASAAIPTSARLTTTQLVQYHNKNFLLDCAEGTQKQLRIFKLPMMGINHIFISHIHGDHYLGLPGLIFTMHLLGRKKPLHIYSPQGMQEIIDLQYRISNLVPGFEIRYHVISQGGQIIYHDNQIMVESIEMEHTIETYGFLIREKQEPLKIRKKAIEKYNISVADIKRIKAGKDLKIKNNEVIPNSQLTLPPAIPRSYAFCSDTGFTSKYIEQIKHADLLYHEATFLHDKVDIATQKTHCTALQAAQIASQAQVRQLMIGHYSARYDELSELLAEAKSEFENTIIAMEGDVIELPYKPGEEALSEE